MADNVHCTAATTSLNSCVLCLVLSGPSGACARLRRRAWRVHDQLHGMQAEAPGWLTTSPAWPIAASFLDSLAARIAC